MSTTTIEGKVTLSGEQAAAVIRHLNDRITALESRLEFDQRDAAEQCSERIPEIIKYLRLHSVVLLYTGQGRAEDLAIQIRDHAARAALEQAWNLDHAPLPQAVIDQVRAATLGGMNRF